MKNIYCNFASVVMLLKHRMFGILFCFFTLDLYYYIFIWLIVIKYLADNNIQTALLLSILSCWRLQSMSSSLQGRPESALGARGVQITEFKESKINPEPIVLEDSEILMEQYLSPGKLVCITFHYFTQLAWNTFTYNFGDLTSSCVLIIYSVCQTSTKYDLGDLTSSCIQIIYSD